MVIVESDLLSILCGVIFIQITETRWRFIRAFWTSRYFEMRIFSYFIIFDFIESEKTSDAPPGMPPIPSDSFSG